MNKCLKISQLLIFWLGLYIMFHLNHEISMYSVLNHNSLFSHFTNLFFLESTEILKLCVAKIITPL